MVKTLIAVTPYGFTASTVGGGELKSEAKDERPLYKFLRYMGKVTCPQCSEDGYAELGEILGVQVVHITHKKYFPELRQSSSSHGVVTVGAHYCTMKELEAGA